MLDFINNWPIALRFITFIALLVVGAFALVKCCNIFVDGASSLAKKLNISPLVIGLTVVAIGTSFPELAVSVSDSITSLIEGGHANIAIGNVVGSNIANLLVVLSAGAIITPIIVKKNIVKRNYSFLLVVSVLFAIFTCFFGLGSILGGYAITRIESIILVLFIPLYIYLLIHFARKDKANGIKVEEAEIKEMSLTRSIIYTLIGAAGVALGGEIVVYGAKSFALEIANLASLNKDLAESLVSLTIVALGTSLPEIATSVAASKKGQNELALGNAIGSNIFNIIFVIGIAGIVNPLVTDSNIIIDICVMLFATILVFFIALKGKITKKHSYIMIALYLAYVVFLVLRTLLF